MSKSKAETSQKPLIGGSFLSNLYLGWLTPFVLKCQKVSPTFEDLHQLPNDQKPEYLHQKMVANAPSFWSRVELLLGIIRTSPFLLY